MIGIDGCKNKLIPHRNSAQDGGPNAPRSQFSDQFCRQRVENKGSYFSEIFFCVHRRYTSCVHRRYISCVHRRCIFCVHRRYVFCVHRRYIFCAHRRYIFCVHRRYICCVHRRYIFYVQRVVRSLGCYFRSRKHVYFGKSPVSCESEEVKVTKYRYLHQVRAKVNASADPPDPADPADPPDQVSETAARTLPSTRAGGQDDGS